MINSLNDHLTRYRCPLDCLLLKCLLNNSWNRSRSSEVSCDRDRFGSSWAITFFPNSNAKGLACSTSLRYWLRCFKDRLPWKLEKKNRYFYKTIKSEKCENEDQNDTYELHLTQQDTMIWSWCPYGNDFSGRPSPTETKTTRSVENTYSALASLPGPTFSVFQQ